MKHKKKIFITIGVGLVLMLIINYRTPFLTTPGGGWSIGYGKSISFPSKDMILNSNIYSIETLKSKNDSTVFLADPFFLKEKDTFYLFFEHKKNKLNAEISLLTSVDGIKYDYKGTVLNEKFHLSYPQVFKHKNEFYMIPESQGANNVLLYKSYRFPYDWRVCDTLIPNIKLKDPSIYVSDSLNILIGSDSNMNMFMYTADSLFGNWRLHKKSTVIVGTEARAGGRIFNDGNGGLVVPIQNCTKGYGYGISLYNIRFNTSGDYQINRINPLFLEATSKVKEFSAGMHHFDIQKIDNEYYYVFDGNRLTDKPKQINMRGPLKWNYMDLKNWVMNF